MYALSLKRANELEELASWVRTETGEWAAPVNLDRMLQRLGVVTIPRLPPDAGRAEAVLKMGSGRPLLYIAQRQLNQNQRAYDHRKRFTQAHEIGHLTLHQDIEDVHREMPNERRRRAANGDAEYCTRENEADAFAAALLMPRAWIKDDLDHLSCRYIGDDLLTLTDRYKVSEASLIRRLAWLRGGLTISGEAFSDSGKIIWVFPSEGLEAAHPTVAATAWYGNGVVANHHTHYLPRKSIPGPNAMTPVWRWGPDDVCLGDITRRPVDQSRLCSLEVWRHTDDHVFFEMIVE